jgi:hypothetical protein
MQLLLGYLPPNPDDWDEALARSRTQYLMFCQVRGAAAAADSACSQVSGGIGLQVAMGSWQ